MGWLSVLGSVLSWPEGSGLAGTAIFGLPALVHAHWKAGKRQRERIDQAERHHEERMREQP